MALAHLPFFPLHDGATSEGDPLTRQRFTVAHEIGHYVLHQHLEDEIFYRLQADTFGDGLQEENKLREAEANAFAASLLMPSFLVFDYWALTKDERRMARSFAVSPIAMHWRLVNLGIWEY